MIVKPILLGCVSLMALLPAQALAATPQVDSAATTGATEQRGLEEIVVTATRRSVDLQQVPATIMAVSSASLEALNIDSVLQLPSLVPGLVVTPAGGNNVYLRGIGSASTGYNEGQSAVYLDGLYLANPALGITSFNNIDRIEVLKGPQGTLYGRNVTGGLISVITRDPGDEPRGEISLGYANYQTVTVNFYGATPLSETVSASLAFIGQKQNKGWSVNLFNGNRDQEMEEIGVQAKLQWRPGPDTKVTGTFIYGYNDRDYAYARQVAPGTLSTDGTPHYGEYRYASRIDPKAPLNAYIASLKIEQDLGFAQLMSLTGYQQSRQRVLFGGSQPGLGQPLPQLGVAYNDFLQSNRSWSQEFQLSSHESGSRLEWVAGAFYFNDKTRLRLDNFNTCVGNVCATPFTPTRNEGRPTTKSYSVYGDATYRFLEATRLTLGLRYTNETKGLSGLVTPLAGRPNSVTSLPAGTVTYPGEVINGVRGIPTRMNFEELTYRAVLAQDITDTINVYLSHNYGFKSGAYNGNSFTNPPVDPEKLYSYEAGFKSELFDRRVRLNIAYFHYDYKDIQVRSTAPPAPQGQSLLLNIAEAKYDGVDVDFTIAAAPGLTINGGFEYLDAKFSDYPGASCVTPGTRLLNGALVGAATVTPCNLAGYRVPNAPEYSGTIGFSYVHRTDIGTFRLNANDRFHSAYPLTPEGAIRQPKRHIIDASLMLTTLDGTLDINLWGRNLTDQYTFAAALAGRDLAVIPGAPRTYGVTVTGRF